MDPKQIFESALIDAASVVLTTEKTKVFYRRSLQTHNTGQVRPGTPLQLTRQKGAHETASYELAPGAKPSDVISGLVTGKYACQMTCQMMRQLLWYKAILSTLTHADALGQARGEEVFNQLFTEIFPFILRDFEVYAGTPLNGKPPFSFSRGFTKNVRLHPLLLFISSNLSSPDKFQVGDSVIYSNFCDYTQHSSTALMKNPAEATVSDRRIAAICLGKNNGGSPIFYGFETNSLSLTPEEIAKILCDNHNKNLRILGKTSRNTHELFEADYFYDQQYHEHFNIQMLSFLIHDPDNALKQIKEMKEALDGQIKMVNLIDNTTPLETLKKMQETFAKKGVEFYSQAKYPQAIQAFTLAITNLLKSVEGVFNSKQYIPAGAEISSLYYHLAGSYELSGSSPLARYFFEAAINSAAATHNPVNPKALEGLARMDEKIGTGMKARMDISSKNSI